MSESFTCHRCKQTKSAPKDSCATGYAVTPSGKQCYACCALDDIEYMREHGKIILYLTCEPASKMKQGRLTEGKVINWPGTLSFRCHTRVGRHNIARYRYDVWFTGPDGKPWHGVTYGDNTQICHCRRIKG